MRRLIDEENLQEPLEHLPPDLLHLIPAYLERREKEVDELRDYVKNGDFAAIKHIGHKLKGTGAGYGFQIITDIGRELESAAASENLEMVQISVDDLQFVSVNLKKLLTRMAFSS